MKKYRATLSKRVNGEWIDGGIVEVEVESSNYDDAGDAVYKKVDPNGKGKDWHIEALLELP